MLEWLFALECAEGDGYHPSFLVFTEHLLIKVLDNDVLLRFFWQHRQHPDIDYALRGILFHSSDPASARRILTRMGSLASD
jgi:hypothetical protein